MIFKNSKPKIHSHRAHAGSLKMLRASLKVRDTGFCFCAKRIFVRHANSGSMFTDARPTSKRPYEIFWSEPTYTNIIKKTSRCSVEAQLTKPRASQVKLILSP